LALEVLAARLGCRVRLGGLDSRRDSMNAQRNENDRARRDGGGDGAAPAPEQAKPETPADAPPPRPWLRRLFAFLIAAGVALLLFNYWRV
jgi:hypothetical protein